MKKLLPGLLLNVIFIGPLIAQVNNGVFRFPDVSKTQIVFSYANDIWIIPKEGGAASKLSSPAGVEVFPKFSPDGRSIAYTGNYDGNRDVYVIPVNGGVPQRLTQHGGTDMVIDWTTDGKRVLFASTRESGKSRFRQFYTISATGGSAEKLPLAYAEFGSYSPDGKKMALTFQSQIFSNWKRYRGGSNADIHIFNFDTKSSENITSNNDAPHELPMWNGNYIYFLSDRGAEGRMNLWRYNLTNKLFEQLTKFTDDDTHFPSMGPDEIVFEQGGKIYLFELASQKLKTVNVTVINDRSMLKPKLESAEKLVQHVNISPDGNRVLVEGRGDIFSLPAKDGYVKNLSITSGFAERYPAWSPDGKQIAYWSDRSGEYELYIAQQGQESTPKKLTNYGAGFRYNLFWSPDSKKLAFIDKAAKIKIYDIPSDQTINVDQALSFAHGNLEGFTPSWSPDSRWLAYDRDLNNKHNAIFIYDFKNKKTVQVTSGFYYSRNPVFDPEGKYLYLLTGQSFQPSYSDFDNTFIYANSTKIAAISLKKETVSLLAPKNDSVSLKEEAKTATASDTSKKDNKDKEKEKSADKKPDVKPVIIQFDGLESRMVLLTPAAGNIRFLNAAKGKIVYMRFPNTGSSETQGQLKYYDIDKREEKLIVDAVNNYKLSSNRQKILVNKSGAYAVLSPDENQKFEKPLRLNEMMVSVDPVQEWKQIFNDAWRLQRDYFYDPNMHGVNWNNVRNHYGKMIDNAMSREDVNFIIGEMIGELSSSHTYHGGGDLEQEKIQPTGYLGINWEADGKYYKVKNILKAAPWDAEVHSSIDVPGIAINEGDYILAVNGLPLTTNEEPFAAFQGLSNKTVELTYNTTPSWTGAKTAIVQTMENEYRLRNLAWIEGMRKRVEHATNGDVGYIYVPSTGRDGQTELMRQYNAQTDKKALIIDERFNDGGQIPDRFVEMLNRTPIAYWAIRDGQAWPWPPNSQFGPKVMLMNGWSGSGGDAFPDYFRKKGLGPLIGSRTWGGLIGISGVPGLIDGGGITVPTFRMYNIDGTWFKEGHGVDPDIDVPEDLGAMAKGTDVQLERAITEIKTLLKTKGYLPPKLPTYEKR